MDLSQEIAKIDVFIRSGQGRLARRALRELAGSKIPTERVREVANLARRVNLLSLSLRLLNPVVRPTGKTSRRASDAEKAEYAACLTFAGATEEARAILRVLDVKTVPEALLFQAFALFGEWDYATAIPILEQYLREATLTLYQRLVGELNLLAALVYERRHEAAESVSQEFLRESEGKGFDLLRGSAYELSAQSYLWQKRWKDSAECLDRAFELLQYSEGRERFFVLKWQAFLSFVRSGGAAPEAARIEEMRLEAARIRHWESVRDCRRMVALVRSDESLLTHVYFGTPHETYRRRALLDFGRPIEFPESYLWQMDEKMASTCSFDVLLGEGTRRTQRLKPGQLQHRLLVSLAADFFRPLRVAVAHHHLYPEEFYNPVTSPARVHEAVRRLRHWLKRVHLPFTVEELDGYYRLAATGPCALRVRLQQSASTEGSWLLRLEAGGMQKGFSARQAEQVLGLSGQSVRRMLLEGIESGNLTKDGLGPATRYSIFKKAG